MKIRRTDELITIESLFEELAELEHQQWWEWSYELAGKENLSLQRVERWRKFWCPYEELPEEHKKSDREWAAKVMEIIKRRKEDIEEDECPKCLNTAGWMEERGYCCLCGHRNK